MLKKYCITIIIFIMICGFYGSRYWQAVRAQTTTNSTSIGASPATIKNLNLLPGSSFTQEVILSRSAPETDANATLEVDATTGIKNWISFTPGNVIVMPKGEQRVPVTMLITVPSTAQLGKYPGYIRVKLEQKDSKGQIILVPAVRLDLDLAVSNEEFRKLRVISSSIADFSASAPLSVNLKMENLGNVQVKADKISLNISNLSQQQVATLKTENLLDIPAFTTKEINAVISDHGLKQGSYFAQLDVYFDSKNIYSNQLSFKVEPAVITALTDDTRANLQQIFTILLGALAVIIALFFYLLLTGKKKKRLEQKLLKKKK